MAKHAVTTPGGVSVENQFHMLWYLVITRKKLTLLNEDKTFIHAAFLNNRMGHCNCFTLVLIKTLSQRWVQK